MNFMPEVPDPHGQDSLPWYGSGAAFASRLASFANDAVVFENWGEALFPATPAPAKIDGGPLAFRAPGLELASPGGGDARPSVERCGLPDVRVSRHTHDLLIGKETSNEHRDVARARRRTLWCWEADTGALQDVPDVGQEVTFPSCAPGGWKQS